MALTDRVKALEKRIDILDASEAKWQGLVDEQMSALTEVILANIVQMRTWLDDLQKHFEFHNLDKKNQYASKRKTIYKEYTNE